MSDQILHKVQQEYLKKEVPVFGPGDTVRVHLRIVEGGKTRTQVFQGIVIACRGKGTDKTFTVRKIAAGHIGVERVFPLYAPVIQKIEVVSRGKVRRAKLTYLRKRVGKAAKVKELRLTKKQNK